MKALGALNSLGVPQVVIEDCALKKPADRYCYIYFPGEFSFRRYFNHLCDVYKDSRKKSVYQNGMLELRNGSQIYLVCNETPSRIMGTEWAGYEIIYQKENHDLKFT